MAGPCRIFQAIQFVHDKLAEANAELAAANAKLAEVKLTEVKLAEVKLAEAKPTEGTAKPIGANAVPTETKTDPKADPQAANRSILWGHIAKSLSALKLPYDADTCAYARHLAPILSQNSPVSDEHETAGRVVRSMQAASQHRLELWAEAVIGMPSIADHNLPVGVLYLYCLRVVGLGVLGAHSQEILNNLANNSVTDASRLCLRQGPTLTDCIRLGLEPYCYDRVVLMSLIGFANCVEAGVSPHDDRSDEPPLSLNTADDYAVPLKVRRQRLDNHELIKAGPPFPNRRSEGDARRRLDKLYSHDELRMLCVRSGLSVEGSKSEVISKLVSLFGRQVHFFGRMQVAYT